MAIAIVDFDVAEITAPDDALTVSITTSGSDRALLVGVVTVNGTLRTVSGVTFNGSATGWTQSTNSSVDHSNNEDHAEFWQLTAPAATTANVVVTLSGSGSAAVAVWALSGVDQSTPVSSANAASGAGSLASVNLTVANANSLLLDVMDVADTTAPDSEAAQTDDALSLYNSDVSYWGASHKSASDDTTMSWTVNDDNWVSSGVVIKEAGGGGGGSAPMFRGT